MYCSDHIETDTSPDSGADARPASDSRDDCLPCATSRRALALGICVLKATEIQPSADFADRLAARLAAEAAAPDQSR